LAGASSARASEVEPSTATVEPRRSPGPSNLASSRGAGSGRRSRSVSTGGVRCGAVRGAGTPVRLVARLRAPVRCFARARAARARAARSLSAAPATLSLVTDIAPPSTGVERLFDTEYTPLAQGCQLPRETLGASPPDDGL